MGCRLSSRIQGLETRIEVLSSQIETQTETMARLQRQQQQHRGLALGSEAAAGRRSSSSSSQGRAPLQGYALYIACDEYRTPQLENLRAAKRDAEALSLALERRGFKTIDKLYDERVTPQNIMMSLSKLSRLSRSKAVIFMAGHGVTHPRLKRVFFACHNTNTGNLISTAFDILSFRNYHDFLTRQQLFLLDFCFSGGCASFRNTSDASAFDPCIYMISAGRSNEVVIELDSSFSSLQYESSESSREPSPTHAGGGGTHQSSQNGAVVAAGRLRPSLVRSKVRSSVHGLFTAALVRCLTKNQDPVSATELFLRCREEVEARAKMQGVAQVPQLHRVPYWKNKRAEGTFVLDAPE